MRVKRIESEGKIVERREGGGETFWVVEIEKLWGIITEEIGKVADIDRNWNKGLVKYGERD